MGNEKSVPCGIDMKQEIITITDNWIQKTATINGGATRICVFEQQLVDRCEEVAPFYKFAKNLMVHRHPYILRYISSWDKNGRLFVATESASPLSKVIENQSPLQLCVGLYNILKAIIFLHEKACSSHNNICKDAIYVTSDGTWKLGTLEYLSKFNEVTSSYLSQTRMYRYKPAIDPNEATIGHKSPNLIDRFAFMVLALEILEEKTDDDIPSVTEFKEVCRMCIEGKDTITLQELTSHPFFSHGFIAIYTFLTELPLRDEVERTQFFRTIGDELSFFPEELVASQLSMLLLSRMVLLDATAQTELLPRMLSVKTANDDRPLFTEKVSKQYIGPRLLNMFCIRDSQIRLMLLRHFSLFCKLFSNEQLETMVLPELLVGIKDTNEELVESTLRALADLIPILGASVVIGKGRAKLFADGRPTVCKESTKKKSEKIRRNSQHNMMMKERASPDGGEDDTKSDRIQDVLWTDWHDDKQEEESAEEHDKEEDKRATNQIVISPDLASLDIKYSQSDNNCVRSFSDIDKMFKDMEPIIAKTKVLNISQNAEKKKFQVSSNIPSDFDGWDDHNMDIDNWTNNV